MRHQEPSVSWDAARELAYKTGQDNGARPASVDLAHCTGLTLAQGVTAEFDVPHYASSAMDGWAIAGAPPWELVLPGTALSPGEATSVVTGGLIPAGAEAVLRSEYGRTESFAEQTLLHRLRDVPATEPPPGRHIRHTGEEAAAGEPIIAAGTKLTPAHVAIAAVCGHDQLPVYPRPSAALLLTGDEVVTSGVPAPGQVRDTFGPTLPSIIHVLGGEASSSRRLPDDFEATRRAILECGGDVVITTGGTGHSRADHLRRVLSELQAEVLAPSIRMRPGHPALMARLADGRTLIGLPGNPLAAMMALLTLGGPLLAGMTGGRLPGMGRVAAGTRFAPLDGKDRLIPYAMTGVGAVPASHVGSAMMRGLANADGVIVVPPEGAAVGQELRTLSLPW